MSDSSWYYAKDNQQQGPVDQAWLCSLFSSNQLPLETLVWATGMANWLPASQVEIFAQAAKPAAKAAAEPLASSAPAATSSAPSRSEPRYDKETGEIGALKPDYTGGFETSPEQFRFDEAQSPADNAQPTASAAQPVMQANMGTPEAQQQPSSAWYYNGQSGQDNCAAPNAVSPQLSDSGSPIRSWNNLNANAPAPAAQPSDASQAWSEQGQQAENMALPGNMAADNPRLPKFVSGAYVNLDELNAIPTPTSVKAQPNDQLSSSARLKASLIRSRQAAPPDEEAPPIQQSQSRKAPPPRRIVDPTSSSTHKTLPPEVLTFSGVSGVAFMQSLRRFGARYIDALVFSIPGLLAGLLISAAIGFIAHDSKLADGAMCVWPLLLVISCLSLEVASLTIFGTTPGKKVLGIRLLPPSGSGSLGFEHALKRTLWCYFYIGWAFVGIPPLFDPLLAPMGFAHILAFTGNLIVFGMTAFQFHRFMNTGITAYDKRTGVNCRFVW